MRAFPLALLAASALLLAPRAAPGAESSAVLTLDSRSLVSFQDRRMLSLPAGSTITLRFDEPQKTGELPFTIAPEGVEIPALEVGSGEATLRYSLRSPATGVLRRQEDGSLAIRFTAELAATLSGTESDGTKHYTVRFTTAESSASSRVDDGRVSARGARVAEGTRYVRLVGATANALDAYPEPGRAVYAVLSGRFDRLPRVE